MLIRLPGVLTPVQVAFCLQELEAAPWVDGKATAGMQSALAKANLQLSEGSAPARALGDLVLGALGRDGTFISAALPLRVFPPLFSRYDPGMGFGSHVDNAIRFTADGARHRADIACTLFLSDPDAYAGGELIIEDGFGPQTVKLPAGDIVVYPASSIHRVERVTAGRRLACVFWVQSMVQDDGRRALLHDLDRSIIDVRRSLGDDHRAVVGLTGGYHNLLRMWATF
jgi:PKHD-type hydroxylase